MSKKQTKPQRRARRHARIRSRVQGTPERPRMCVFRSAMRMYVQIIDDEAGKTLVSGSTAMGKATGDVGSRVGKVAKAYLLGKTVAEKAKAAKITTVVFDRGGYAYHGRVQAVAEGARDGGLVF